MNEEGKVSSFYIGVEGKINDTTLDIEVAFKMVETEIGGTLIGTPSLRGWSHSSLNFLRARPYGLAQLR